MFIHLYLTDLCLAQSAVEFCQVTSDEESTQHFEQSSSEWSLGSLTPKPVLEEQMEVVKFLHAETSC